MAASAAETTLAALAIDTASLVMANMADAWLRTAGDVDGPDDQETADERDDCRPASREGFRVSKRTVARLMQEKGIRPARGRRRVPITTDSCHGHAIAPNLLERKFDVAITDTVWLADICAP